MGVYTWTKNPLGLALNPRLEELLEKYHNNEELEREDIGFLLDESAKFETIRTRVRGGHFKLKGRFMEDEHDIREVLGELFEEIDYLYATQITKDKVYSYELQQFYPYRRDIATMDAESIKWEVRNAIEMVQKMQKQFDDNKDGLKVIGHFKYLKRDYRLELEVTAESKEEDILQGIVEGVLPKVEEEAKKQSRALETLSSLKEDKK